MLQSVGLEHQQDCLQDCGDLCKGSRDKFHEMIHETGNEENIVLLHKMYNIYIPDLSSASYSNEASGGRSTQIFYLSKNTIQQSKNTP